VSDKGDLPSSLRKLFKDFEEDEEESSSTQLTSQVPVSTTPLPVVVAPVVTRARNFKHKKLASYYKTVNGEQEEVDGGRGDTEVEESEVQLKLKYCENIGCRCENFFFPNIEVFPYIGCSFLLVHIFAIIFGRIAL
jgi:hypothetical protein